MSFKNLNNGHLPYIKFFPTLQKYLKCERSSLLISHLEYWFSKEKFKDGFFKFLEPCPHRLCKEGDSWAEELGWKRDLFKRTFDKIGKRYTSKTAYKEAQQNRDAFQGKLYACYYDRKTNKTFFIKNNNLADIFFQELKMSFSTASSHKKKEPQIFQHIPPQKTTLAQYSSEENAQSPIDTKINTNNLSSMEKKSKPNNVEKIKKDENKIIKDNVLEKALAIWKKRIGDGRIWNKVHTLQKLKQAFLEFFESSLEKWDAFCLKVASSKFLMGEKGPFKILLDWAIKPEIIVRILENGFTFGDRDTETEKEKEEKAKKTQIIRSRFYEIMENEEEKNKFLDEFICTSPYISIVNCIKKNGLGAGIPTTFFESFVKEKIREALL